MKAYPFLVGTVLLLSSCLTINHQYIEDDDDNQVVYREIEVPPQVPEKIPEYPHPIEPKSASEVRIVEVIREIGCPPMPLPRLSGVPAPPRSAVGLAQNHAEIDRILTGYISNLQGIIRNNNRVVRQAVQRNNARCKR